MSLNGQLRAAIIGCGQIAGAYDDSSPSDTILTHAKAYQRHPQTDLIAVADADGSKAKAFATRWGAPSWYSDAAEMLHAAKPDIVSICSPDALHAEHLELCLSVQPRIVWCEKPLAIDVRDGERLAAEFKKRQILLAVNYQRRWDRVIQRLGQTIRSTQEPVTVIVHYGKGLLHSGSHAIDLLVDWFGDVQGSSTLDSVVDYDPADPTLTAHVRFANGAQAMLVAHDERAYTLWEIDVIGPSWRSRIADAGNRIEEFDLQEDAMFPGYRVLRNTGSVPTDADTVVYLALEDIMESCDQQRSPRSNGETALATLRACHHIKNERPHS